MIYTHVLNRGGRGVLSPVDLLSSLLRWNAARMTGVLRGSRERDVQQDIQGTDQVWAQRLFWFMYRFLILLGTVSLGLVPRKCRIP